MASDPRSPNGVRTRVSTFERVPRAESATCGGGRNGPLIGGFGSWLVPVATPRFSMSCGIFAGSPASGGLQPPLASVFGPRERSSHHGVNPCLSLHPRARHVPGFVPRQCSRPEPDERDESHRRRSCTWTPCTPSRPERVRLSTVVWAQRVRNLKSWELLRPHAAGISTR
jgi:hypothetical protein